LGPWDPTLNLKTCSRQTSVSLRGVAVGTLGPNPKPKNVFETDKRIPKGGPLGPWDPTLNVKTCSGQPSVSLRGGPLGPWDPTLKVL
jgi:hypothetical protein